MPELFDKARDAASYNDIAEAYFHYINNWLSPPLARHICDLAALRSGDRVLDVGTGTGVAALEADKQVGPSGLVTAIDLSEGMIRKAQLLYPPEQSKSMLNFLVMDAENLKFPDANFNAVISLCAVAHFPSIGTALTEMRRVLEPGGRVVVSFGYTRPIRPLPLARHYWRQLVREGLRRIGLKPLCKAPSDLISLVKRRGVMLDGEGVETEWSRHNPRTRLIEEVKRVGFLNVRTDWFGHDVFFSSGHEFLEAQMAIVTLLRTGFSKIATDQQEQIETEFLAITQKVLRQGGNLVYPYGAFYVMGVAPGVMVASSP